MKLGTKWRKFVGLPPDERILLAQTLRSLVWARLTLSLVPFSRLPKHPRVSPVPTADPTRLVWAVKAIARYVPGATCLVRALAAQRLLARHGYASDLQIGVTKNSANFEAHAWVEYRGAVLIGASDQAFIPLLQWGEAR